MSGITLWLHTNAYVFDPRQSYAYVLFPRHCNTSDRAFLWSADHQKTTVSARLRQTLKFHQGRRMWSSLPNMFRICRHCHTDGNDWKEHVQTDRVGGYCPVHPKHSSPADRHLHCAAGVLFSDTCQISVILSSCDALTKQLY